MPLTRGDRVYRGPIMKQAESGGLLRTESFRGNSLLELFCVNFLAPGIIFSKQLKHYREE